METTLPVREASVPATTVVHGHVIIARMTASVVHHPYASVVHRNMTMSDCSSRCGLVHVSIV